MIRSAKHASSPPASMPRPPRRTKKALFAALLTLAIAAPAAAPADEPATAPPTGEAQTDASVEFGRMLVTQRCANCHAIAEGEDRFAAPLHHLYGRLPGRIEGYTFSINMQRIGTPWTARTLEQWLAQTTFDTPDIRMRHVGIERADQRHAVVDFLSSLPGNATPVQE